jgi:hypothetical protein
MASYRDYDIVASAQRDLTRDSAGEPRRALVQAAVLAPSSHNTQPWRFRVASNSITIEPDFSRRCGVVDPDDSHLFKSLGCAAENIAAAAPAYGYQANIQLQPTEGRIVVGLESRAPDGNPTALKIITGRQCTKRPYDGKALRADAVCALEAAGLADGVRVQIIEDARTRESILDYVSHGNQSQLSDGAFRRELISWIRFNCASAIRSGDGLSVRTGGQPSLPTWLARLIVGFVLTPKAQIDTDAENIRSSSGVAVFIADADDRRAWMETGRAYERFALAATAHGIRNAFINQPIEVRQLRPQLHALLGLQGAQTALLMIRYGFAPAAPYSLRRPLADVIVKEANEIASPTNPPSTVADF